MIKYIVCPAHVRAKSDGDTHFISYNQLINLYCVHPSQCTCYSGEPGERYEELTRRYPDAVWLHPRAEGDYGRWLADRRPRDA